MSSAPTTLVVMPTYNEAANLERIAAALLARTEQGLLIVDDSSPDGTGQLADALAARYPDRVSVIHRPAKQGLGTAYVAGFREALRRGPEFIVQMDADFSHDPADVARLVAACQSADVAIGSRYVRGGGSENWPLIRRLVSRGGSLYTQLVLGLAVQDPTSGFQCFRREALAQIDLDHIRAQGFSFQVEMKWRSRHQGLKLVEVPIRFVDRKLGESKMSKKIFFEGMLLVWRLRVKGVDQTRPKMTAS
jgi:dolichol-phosphate mannosyltransferase